MASNAGREGGFLGGIGNAVAGLAGGNEEKGLKTVNPELSESKQKDGDSPNIDIQRAYGDVDKATPHEPVNASKQHMEQDRGQKFHSATGKEM